MVSPRANASAIRAQIQQRQDEANILRILWIGSKAAWPSTSQGLARYSLNRSYSFDSIVLLQSFKLVAVGGHVPGRVPARLRGAAVAQDDERPVVELVVQCLALGDNVILRQAHGAAGANCLTVTSTGVSDETLIFLPYFSGMLPSISLTSRVSE